jgi:hypothetical protein
MSKTIKDRHDDPSLSKNHNKSIKYRLRVQQDKEVSQEMKQLELFDQEEVDEDRPHVRRVD